MKQNKKILDLSREMTMSRSVFYTQRTMTGTVTDAAVKGIVMMDYTKDFFCMERFDIATIPVLKDVSCAVIDGACGLLCDATMSVKQGIKNLA